MNTIRMLFTATMLISLLAIKVANADVLVTNMTEPLNPNGPTTIGNTPGGPDDQVWGAQAFVTAASPWSLTSIDAMTGSATAGNVPILAQLRRDTGINEIDMTAGGLIASFLNPPMTGATTSRNFSLAQPELLDPHTKYWFMFGIDAADLTNTFQWEYANTGIFSGSGSLAEFGESHDLGGTWSYPINPYFPWMIQVNGNVAVPEPATAGMGAIAFMLCFFRRRRKPTTSYARSQ